jgi:2'-hydroxyisoflavone reductase
MTFDAIVDVARHPGHVRRAVAELRRPNVHWTLVSTVSVYADNRTPGQQALSAPLLAPAPDAVEQSTPETYGSAKRACEMAVGDGAFICRAGLIVGPEDPTGRFTYWPQRLHRGGEVLVAGSPDDDVQFVDVRDLAGWIVEAAEHRLIGTIDGAGPSTKMGSFLNACADSVGASCTYTWVDREFMNDQKIRHWAGPRSLPLWVPLPDFAGLMTRDVSQALACGLKVRPLTDTARDTLHWTQTNSAATIIGITAEEEADALAAWHTKRTA